MEVRGTQKCTHDMHVLMDAVIADFQSIGMQQGLACGGIEGCELMEEAPKDAGDNPSVLYGLMVTSSLLHRVSSPQRPEILQYQRWARAVRVSSGISCDALDLSNYLLSLS